MLLTVLQPTSITATHLHWLQLVCSMDYTGVQPKHYLADALEGKVLLWDFDSGNGIVLTQLLQHPAGKEVFILGLAGTGLIRKVKTLNEIIQTYAECVGARWIGGNVVNARLVPVYEKLLGKSFGVKCFREV